MKKYDTYKDSGIEWIGEIPEHWDAVEFKYLFSFSRGLGITKQDLKDKGIPCVNYGEIHSKFGFAVNPEIHNLKYVEVEYLDTGEKSLLKRGDFVFADTSEDIEGSGNFTVLDSDLPTFAGYHTIICRLEEENNYKYLAFFFDSLEYRNQIRSSVSGIKVFSITQAIIKSSTVLLPPLDEQTAIAEYLDKKTTEVDELISDKEELLKLYEEEKTAVINRAVNKGINPDARMKDSGIEWLGEIPEHWEVKSLKYVMKSLNNIRIPLSADERGKMSIRKYDYYGASGIIDKVEDYLFDESLILIGEDGANLVTRNSRLSFIARGKYWVNNHAHILKPKVGILEYYCELMEICDYTIWISGSAQPKLTSENLMNIKIAVPPTVEQQSIVNYIESETSRIDKKIDETQKLIDLLKEYREALISEVVTGKVKVV
ncbi:MAG: restriction endonuclease subunit S [Moheibacter sp.]